MLHRFIALRPCLLLAACQLVPLTAAEPIPLVNRPNIVVIVADDMGYADLGFTGLKEVATPNIDAIVAHGVHFTQGYASAGICSPSRAGLLTGRYQERWGHDDNACEDLATTESTLGDRLKSLGYTTGMIGKWHQGNAPELLPTRRGFDEVFHPAGNAVYFGAKILDSLRGPDFQPPVGKQVYTTELNAARAADFITRHKNQPFGLYLAFNNVHAPLDVPQKYLDRVTAVTVNPERKVMAGMILALDDAVGVVMKSLRESEVERNTLVVFINDNGSYDKYVKAKVCDQGLLRGGKSTLWEGGIHVPFAMQWKARWPGGASYNHPVIALDVLPTAIAAAGGTIQPTWKLDGVNLLPHLDGKDQSEPHHSLYWRMAQRSAIRTGEWKLLVSVTPNQQPIKPQLFHLSKDPGERHDLANQFPERVRDMQADWNQWASELPPARTEPVKQGSTKTSEQ